MFEKKKSLKQQPPKLAEVRLQHSLQPQWELHHIWACHQWQARLLRLCASLAGVSGDMRAAQPCSLNDLHMFKKMRTCTRCLILLYSFDLNIPEPNRTIQELCGAKRISSLHSGTFSSSSRYSKASINACAIPKQLSLVG